MGAGWEEVADPTGESRWLLRATKAVYSYAATLALADEAWAIEAAVVEDGLEPTLVDHVNGQLVLASTAHRMATALVVVRRAGLFASWGTPTTSLLLEWSAPREASLEDRAAWRLASPHWTPGRERLLEAKLRRATAGHSEDPDEDDPAEGFRSQYLNVWPRRRLVASTASEPLADRETWGHAADLYAAPAEGAPVAVGVEDFLGLKAAAAACCQLPDGRVLVWGGVFEARRDALAWASFTMGTRPGCVLLVGKAIGPAEAAEAIGGRAEVRVMSSTDTGVGLPLLRSLLKSGRLAHSGDPDLADQVATVRLVPTLAGGLSLAHRGIRADLLKAAAWSVAAMAAPEAAALEFFVY
jgi:hypothetical protein